MLGALASARGCVLTFLGHLWNALPLTATLLAAWLLEVIALALLDALLDLARCACAAARAAAFPRLREQATGPADGKLADRPDSDTRGESPGGGSSESGGPGAPAASNSPDSPASTGSASPCYSWPSEDEWAGDSDEDGTDELTGNEAGTDEQP
jgi:hypothetical protein